MRVWLPYASVEEATERLGGIPAGIEVDVYDGNDQLPPHADEVALYVIPYMRGADALRHVDTMTNLQVIQTQTAGYENFVPHVPSGVTLCNAAGVHDASTAELAIALALASGRRLGEAARNQSTGRWEPIFGSALADKRVLIFGYGHIGKAIEARLAGFEVASITRVARSARTEPLVHPVDRLPELLPEADVVMIIAPLTEQTQGLFDAELLKRLPDDALVVNVARGPIVDTDALLAETSSGRLRAGLDVTDPEPLPADHPLWTSPGVIISPHVGGASSAFFPRADRMIKGQLQRLAAGEPLANVIMTA